MITQFFREGVSPAMTPTGPKRKHAVDQDHDQGFSMTELVVIVAIIAILILVGVPNFSNWQANTKLKGAARNVVSTLQLAKIEAAKRNENMLVSFTSGAYTSSGGVGSYQVFVDDGGPGPGGEADGVDNDQDGTTDEADENRFSANGIRRDSIRNGSEEVLAQTSMPPSISLYTANFSGTGSPPANVTGFTPRALPLASADGTAADPGVEIRNNKSTYYRILVGGAGSISIEISRDGTNWE